MLAVVKARGSPKPSRLFQFVSAQTTKLLPSACAVTSTSSLICLLPQRATQVRSDKHCTTIGVDSHCCTTSGDEEIFEVDKILDRRGNEEEGFEYLTVSGFFCVNLLTGVFSTGEGSLMTTIPGNRPRVSKAANT